MLINCQVTKGSPPVCAVLFDEENCKLSSDNLSLKDGDEGILPLATTGLRRNDVEVKSASQVILTMSIACHSTSTFCIALYCITELEIGQSALSPCSLLQLHFVESTVEISQQL